MGYADVVGFWIHAMVSDLPFMYGIVIVVAVELAFISVVSVRRWAFCLIKSSNGCSFCQKHVKGILFLLGKLSGVLETSCARLVRVVIVENNMLSAKSCYYAAVITVEPLQFL